MRKLPGGQSSQKFYHDVRSGLLCTFKVNDPILAKTNLSNGKWLWERGVVRAVEGAVNYRVMIDGREVLKHANQLRPYVTDISAKMPADAVGSQVLLPAAEGDSLPMLPEGGEKAADFVPQTAENHHHQTEEAPAPSHDPVQDHGVPVTQGCPAPANDGLGEPGPIPVARRYPLRNRKPPERLNYRCK